MTKLYRFQKKGVRKLDEFGGRGLLADEMGLGKSIQALWYALHFLDGWPIVIVCPAYPKRHWARECRKHFDKDVVILEGRQPDPVDIAFMKKHAIYVVNYDILTGWWKILHRLKPSLMIVDEGHYIKNPRSKRYKFTKSMSKRVPHILVLTGTPITNRHAELWPILNLIRPDLYKSFWHYATQFCPPTRTPWGFEYKESRNGDVLMKELRKNLMVRRLKEDVLKDLPDKRRIVVPVELTKKQLAEYREAEKNFIDWVQKTHGGQKAARALRAERVTRMGYLRRLVGELKIPTLIDWHQNFLDEEKGKLILFGLHKKVLIPVYEKFRNNSILVTGSLEGSKRQAAFDRFLNKSYLRLLVGNIQAAGMGWSGKGVSQESFAEFCWAPTDITQAEDRIRGIGRGVPGVPPFYYYFVVEGTMDEYLLEVLQEKQKVINAALDGDESAAVDFDVIDLLVDKLLGRK
jgi:SWI/SNF-related matrix-associated actin-dependent regulator of chromatin subfamily A-like protein 1